MTTEKTLDNEVLMAYCTFKLNGKNPDDSFNNDIISVEVEQHLYLPWMVTIRLFNPSLRWFETSEFEIGTTIDVSMGQDKNNLKAVIATAEVVALELDASPLGQPTVTIRAYSKLHRLQRGRKTRSFQDVSVSDLVGQLAGEAGLSADAQSTSQVFKYLFQNNETNLEFLQRLTRQIGMELYVDDKKLKLRKPAVNAGKIASTTWGQDLLHFTSRQSAHGQTDEVTVRGWDPKSKKEIVGNSSTNTHKPKIGTSSDGGAVAKKAFSSATTYSLYQPVVDQTQAQNLAQAIQEDINSRFIQIEAQCLGNNLIAVGNPIEIKGLGTKNSGTYYITSCIHRYDAQGYRVWLEANGRQSHTFMEMVGSVGEQSGNGKSYGPVVGIVSNNKDAEGKMNRVKVQFPWLGDTIESNWARVVTPMTGNGYGAQYLPEINDEVLVAFENGDIHFPYVIGGLWNGKDKPVKDSSEVVGGDGKVNQRIFKTRSGHIMTFDDSEDKPSISIVDKTGKNKITIDSTNNLITVESDKDINLTANNGTIKLEAREIQLKATQNIKADATQNIELKSTADTKVDATGNISMNSVQDTKVAATMNFEASANISAALKGTATAKVEGAKVDIQGSGMVSVTGGVIKLN